MRTEDGSQEHAVLVTPALQTNAHKGVSSPSSPIRPLANPAHEMSKSCTSRRGRFKPYIRLIRVETAGENGQNRTHRDQKRHCSTALRKFQVQKHRERGNRLPAVTKSASCPELQKNLILSLGFPV